MSRRSTISLLVCAAALMSPAGVLVNPAVALGAHSVGSSGQIAWVRRAAGNFISAELAGNGAGACGILNAPLRASEHDRTCAQRWSDRLARVLREPGARARLRTEQRAIHSAVVIVHRNLATIELPAPLLGDSNRLVWTEDCWMVAG
jgi:hypothetical protein